MCFFRSVMPCLQTIELKSKALKLLTEELVAKRDKLIASGMDAPSVQSMIYMLAARRASSKSLPLSYISEVISALDWCMEVNAPDLCNTIVERFIKSVDKFTPRGLEQSMFLSELPKLQAWSTKHKRDLSLVIQKVVTAWIEKVLDIPPETYTSLSNDLAALAEWTCSCVDCLEARKFLTQSEYSDQTLYGAGTHTENYLSKYARNLATWSLTKDRNSRITVRKLL